MTTCTFMRTVTAAALAIAATPAAAQESAAAREGLEILDWFRNGATCQQVLDAMADRPGALHDSEMIRVLTLAVAWGQARALDAPVGEILAQEVGRCVEDMTAPYYPG